MNHVTPQLQAYCDGELKPRAAAAVEAHLAECETCCAEFEALTALSTLLHEVPPAPQLMPEDRFVAQVTLRLRRKPTASLPERTLKRGWALAPFALVATWTFVEAAVILTACIEFLVRMGVGGPVLASLIPEPTVGTAAELGLASHLLDAVGLGQAVEIVGQIPGLGWNVVALVLFAGLTALAICSWLATGWAVQQHSAGASRTE